MPDEKKPVQPQAATAAQEPGVPVLTFQYKRSPQYRTIHVNGAFGGRTMRGEVFAMLYSERPPHPTSSSYRLEDGKPKEEVLELREGIGDMIREVEVCAFMTADQATALGTWLIENANRVREKQPFTAKVTSPLLAPPRE